MNAMPQEFAAVPANIDAEQQLIGALLINNEALEALPSSFDDRHFFEPFHQSVFREIKRLVESGKSANPVTVKAGVDTGAMIGDLTTSQYLARMASEAVSIINVPGFAQAITFDAMRRGLISVGEQAGELGFQCGDELTFIEQADVLGNVDISNAYIGNLIVGTSNIAQGVVVGYSSGSGSDGTVSTTTLTTVATFTITHGSNQPVLDVCAVARAVQGGGDGVAYRLICSNDSSVVFPTSRVFAGSGAGFGGSSISAVGAYKVTNSRTSTTFALQIAKVSAGDASAQTTNTFFKVLEIK